MVIPFGEGDTQKMLELNDWLTIIMKKKSLIHLPLCRC
jgi:hypothetical protein